MNASQRSEDPVLLVRKRGGFAGERERSCHLVPLPDGTSTALLTLCGERIDLGTAELLPAPEGMPCVACLLASPPSGG
ncbi:hypothetical protein AB0G02_14085 [Actinosynnema sp. NPDC023658]|uniref:hypothetical protein n=1 Tax=Actinosynnema sp. NPDC023658 TaxID=3155465 RepID=UPI003401D9E6